MVDTAFQSPALYPELDYVRDRFTVIRDEALANRSAMTSIHDSRVEPGSWQMLALLPEDEDRDVVPEATWRANRRLLSATTRLLAEIPALKAYAISSLAPGGHIRPHRHRNAFVTAALCLQHGGDAHIVVAGQRQQYRDGGLIIFDYTLEHEVFNHGAGERIVLLMLLENRLSS